MDINYANELLDIVDDRDVVIAQAPRHLVHAEPFLLHREVDILVHDEDRRILFQQRSRNKKQNPLHWTSGAGGHVQSGETPENAAKTELFEELGLSGELEFLYKTLVRQDGNHRFAYFYSFKYSGQVITPHPEEIEQIRFVHPNEYHPEIFHPHEANPMAIKTAWRFWQGTLLE